MVLKEVTVVEQRLAMIKAVDEDGVSVVDACRLWGLSRDRFYFWRDRYRAEGVDGLKDRSSRPERMPARMDPVLEVTIVELRKAHKRWGARRIRAELRRRGHQTPPAVSTIHAALVRNGLIATTPAEPVAVKRFERELPGELVQTDAKETTLIDKTKVWIVSLLDDHSRFLLASEAREQLEAADAVAVFDLAASRYGLPYSVLNDRGSCFTGISTKTVGPFERHLWGYGVFTINGRPYHPQTQGKIERFHRTLGEWLEDYGPFTSLAHLQASLDEFRQDYNHERPHQGIDDQTPQERWNAKPQRTAEPDATADRRVRTSIRKVNKYGKFTYSDWIIGVGRAHAGPIKLIDYGHLIELRDENDELIRKITPDYSRRYLGSGRPTRPTL